MLRIRSAKLKCQRQPRYNGRLSPKASCAACMAIWRVRRELEYASRFFSVATIREPGSQAGQGEADRVREHAK